MTDFPLRVAVTGASGYIGGRLVQSLLSDENVEFILATDIRSPDVEHSDRVTFIRHDIGDPFPDLFAKHRINSVVHLAYLLNPGRRRQVSRRVNVTGTDNLIDACAAADVRHVLYLSSTSVYGAHPDNPDFLTEDHPVRPIHGFQYSEDKLESESRLAEFSRRNPSVTVTILRGCPVLGPSSDNFISNAFLKPLLPSIAGADPDMQFLHEDDLVAVLDACLQERPPGAFNVAGDGTIKWSEMAARMGLPSRHTALLRMGRTHLHRLAPAHSERLPLLRTELHPPPLDRRHHQAFGRARIQSCIHLSPNVGRFCRCHTRPLFQRLNTIPVSGFRVTFLRVHCRCQVIR